MSKNTEILSCIECHQNYSIDEIRYNCQCGGLLSVERSARIKDLLSLDTLEQRLLSREPHDVSGVWAFREVVRDIDPKNIVTHPEGRTHLYHRPSLAKYAGIDGVWFKHEGENPTGSFKDRGMTVAVTQAKYLGMRHVGCASTGNTSASLASYAAQAGLNAIVFIPQGKVATGKLAQSVGYGAKTVAIRGDFDTAMQLVREAARELGIYLVNSVNPFRIEGQKTIIFEMLLQRNFEAPDWIVVPAGNLGNTSAFGKALKEAYEAGWIKKIPRIASVQASGANPFYLSYKDQFTTKPKVVAETIATAIRIGDPVNFAKGIHAITYTGGVVTEVTDQQIMLAKRAIDQSGIGAEPASAATLAGVKQLKDRGVIKSTDQVVCILTGHMLKDPEAVLSASNMKVIDIAPNLNAVKEILNS